MTNFDLAEKVTVSAVVDGEQFEGVFGPGVVDMPDAVGDVLVAQGLAKFTATSTADKPRKARSSSLVDSQQSNESEIPTDQNEE
jgi:hypothetical protein